MLGLHYGRSAMRTRRHARACVEGLEPRQLLSVTIFTGKWTGTYQLDAQSTADSTDPHYTGTLVSTPTRKNRRSR